MKNLLFCLFTALLASSIQLRAQLIIHPTFDLEKKGPVTFVEGTDLIPFEAYESEEMTMIYPSVSWIFDNFQVKGKDLEPPLLWGASSNIYNVIPNENFLVSKLSFDSLNFPIGVDEHFLLNMFASVNHLSRKKSPSKGESLYIGDLRIMFNRLVANPILLIKNMGQSIEASGICRAFSLELEMTNSVGHLEKVSGTASLEVFENRIYHGEIERSECEMSNASGLVRIVSPPQNEITFKVYIRRNLFDDGLNGKWPKMKNVFLGEEVSIGLFLEETLEVQGKVTVSSKTGTYNRGIIGGDSLWVHIIEPNQNLVIGAIPVDDSGKFNIKGLPSGNEYFFQLNTMKGSILQKPPALHFPDKAFFPNAKGKAISKESPEIMQYLLHKPGKDLVHLEFKVIDYSKECEIWELAQFKEEPAELINFEEELTARAEKNLLNSMNETAPVNTFITNKDTISRITRNESSDIRSRSVSDSLRTPVFDEEQINYSQNAQLVKGDNRVPVIIVGAFRHKDNASSLINRLVKDNKKVYTESELSGFERVGFFADIGDMDGDINMAKENYDSNAWVLFVSDTMVKGKNQENALNLFVSESTIVKSELKENQSFTGGECIIIVGSFIKPYNADAMVERVLNSGNELFTGAGPGDFSRVGYYVPCISIKEELEKARNLFAADAWQLPSPVN